MRLCRVVQAMMLVDLLGDVSKRKTFSTLSA